MSGRCAGDACFRKTAMAFFFSAGRGGGLASSKRHLVEHVGLVERIMELVGDLLASATRCYPPSYRSRCNRAICPERGSPPSTRSCCARGAHHVCYASSARLSPRRSPRGLRADGLLHGRRFAGATPGSSLVNVNTALRVLHPQPPWHPRPPWHTSPHGGATASPRCRSS